MSARFRPLDYHLAFSLPDRLTDVESWHQHTPFAMALVTVLRPRVLVELGTHRGDSYSAMCQAVDALGISARCFAVDTWRGDEHAGAYDDSVYEELRAYHDPRYGRFSTLVRSTFDDAARHFGDGEIDLLHVDGLHTAEAARHDFETWRPKLSERAVVLFHDTNVRERDFGVWRVWKELSARHPSFEFAHGHGLGVLAVGAAVPAELLELCALADEERRAVMRLYEALGERVAFSRGVRVLRAADAARREALARAETERARTADALAEREERLARAEARVRDLERSLADLHAAAARRIDATGDFLRSRGSLRRRRREKDLRLLRGSGLFDADFYLSANPDVAASGLDPLEHFYDAGAGEGRDPNAWFDTSFYLERDPELAASGLNPLVHYVSCGARELRDPHPEFCSARYLAEHPDAEKDGVTALAHFLRARAERR